MKYTLLAAAAVLGMSPMAHASQGAHVYVPIPINPKPSFAYVDVNEDGVIEADEASHAHVLYGNEFFEADKDKNGWLSKEEYQQAMEKVQKKAQAPRKDNSG